MQALRKVGVLRFIFDFDKTMVEKHIGSGVGLEDVPNHMLTEVQPMTLPSPLIGLCCIGRPLPR